jgi:hypothetical protein
MLENRSKKVQRQEWMLNFHLILLLVLIRLQLLFQLQLQLHLLLHLLLQLQLLLQLLPQLLLQLLLQLLQLQLLKKNPKHQRMILQKRVQYLRNPLMIMNILLTLIIRSQSEFIEVRLKVR